MKPQVNLSDDYAPGTTDSRYLVLEGTDRGVVGLQVTPTLHIKTRPEASTRKRPGVLTVQERDARIAANPLRADGIASGRRTLAAISDHLNPGVRTLQALRLAAGFSQKELAQRMGMLQPNIARLENKPGDPTLSTLKKLSVALNVSVADVVDAIEVTWRMDSQRA